MPQFVSMLPGFDVFESDSSVVYCLDPDFKISYCNAAWDRFAIENNGSKLKRPAPIGLRLEDYLRAPLLDFYFAAFEVVRNTGQPWHHVYECSSPETVRRIHMRVSPAPGSAINSLLVVNSQIGEEPMRRTVCDPTPAIYRHENGFVKMCSGCRRTHRAIDNVWDWVPKYVEEMPPKTTHGLCPLCVLDYLPREVFLE